MKNTLTISGVILLLVMTQSLASDHPPGAAGGKPDLAFQQCYVNPVDDPALPRVLLIGDSISEGYTVPVRVALRGQANVHRVLENCQDSGHGLAGIKGWLGTNHWDVIHFNWGIWDTHGYDKRTGQEIQLQDEGKHAAADFRCRNSLEQYQTNLTKLVAILKGTRATLIWASTTPITARHGARLEVIPRYNAVAAEIMKANGVAVDDLYSLVLPEAARWQMGDGCHFNSPGYHELGKQVSQSIREALQKTPAK